MVANNAELERGYLAARGHSEKPVLLSVEGHFTLELIRIPVRQPKY